MIEFNKHAFQIIHKTSGQALMPEWQGTRPNARGMHHWPLDDKNVNHPDAFLWYFFPKNPYRLSEGFWIINKQSGFVLMPEWQGTRPDARWMQHWPMDDSNINHPSGLLWTLEQQGGYYKLINEKSNFGLMPEWQGTRPGNRGVHHWPMNDLGVTNPDAFLWEIKPVEPVLIQFSQPGLGKHIDRDDKETLSLTSASSPKPISEGVLERQYIPCVAVKDAEKELKWKLENSPYYLLESEGYWVVQTKHFHVNYSSTTTDKKDWTYKKSWTKANQNEFSTTVGITATAGGEVYGGSVTTSLSFTAAFTESLSQTTEELESTEVFIPPGMAKAMFSHENHLSLRRADGTVIKSWIIPDGKTATAEYKIP